MATFSWVQGLGAEELCRIEIVDQDNGWPVPLVELRTTHQVRFVSDNAGIIAFDLPELMGRETWFTVTGHGYEVPQDGFGYRGVRLTPMPGKRLTVKVERLLPAKRLGRITGGGLFGESQRFGLATDWQDQGILGCDSVQTAVHAGRLYWAWGDTVVPGYPLGLFHMISATTDLQPLRSLVPPVRLPYHYFTDASGKPRVVGKMPGEGPTWISGYVSLPDKDGKARLVGTYIKVKGFLAAYECGLCVWNDTEERFERFKVLWTKTPGMPEPPLCPDGHPVFWRDERGKQWVLFGDPFPRIRCAADFESWCDPASWQALEPQETVPVLDGNEAITPHRGSIAWNALRRKWVTAFTQLHGKASALGEIWYAEADRPTGVWGPAVPVVTHANYTFYNPRLHPEWTPENSPVLLFEATYTKQFSKTAEATPRHDYNQILYRLDLDDPALVSPLDTAPAP
jgi:hypothetical protein